MTSWHGVFDKAGISSMNSSSFMYKDNNTTANYKAIMQFKYYLSICLKLPWSKPWSLIGVQNAVSRPSCLLRGIFPFKPCPQTWVKWYFSVYFNLLGVPAGWSVLQECIRTICCAIWGQHLVHYTAWIKHKGLFASFVFLDYRFFCFLLHSYFILIRCTILVCAHA